MEDLSAMKDDVLRETEVRLMVSSNPAENELKNDTVIGEEKRRQDGTKLEAFLDSISTKVQQVLESLFFR